MKLVIFLCLSPFHFIAVSSSLQLVSNKQNENRKDCITLFVRSSCFASFVVPCTTVFSVFLYSVFLFALLWFPLNFLDKWSCTIKSSSAAWLLNLRRSYWRADLIPSSAALHYMFFQSAEFKSSCCRYSILGIYVGSIGQPVWAIWSSFHVFGKPFMFCFVAGAGYTAKSFTNSLKKIYRMKMPRVLLNFQSALGNCWLWVIQTKF